MPILGGLVGLLGEIAGIKNAVDSLFGGGGGGTSASSGAPVAAITTPVILSPTSQAAPSPAPSPAPASQGIPMWVWVAGGAAVLVAIGLIVWGVRR